MFLLIYFFLILLLHSLFCLWWLCFCLFCWLYNYLFILFKVLTMLLSFLLVLSSCFCLCLWWLCFCLYCWLYNYCLILFKVLTMFLPFLLVLSSCFCFVYDDCVSAFFVGFMVLFCSKFWQCFCLFCWFYRLVFVYVYDDCVSAFTVGFIIIVLFCSQLRQCFCIFFCWVRFFSFWFYIFVNIFSIRYSGIFVCLVRVSFGFHVFSFFHSFFVGGRFPRRFS